ncbi:oxidoreductase [Nocardia pseudobrasiliensis]|uniref:NADP-dependent 3-hydroxy acid dehydrogenase YdfG n=1 Tax=Nocardia pseudobrasiliensis TaxID=45979 RepID=A0A370HWT9_9NOCA|nr:oxidoreductase [Nocardia pseudobrasiliensis]RDI62948.1 NADP-dependent 3-hydroxy acid dehydrogenase YdfG [Nocardia pseudobrasiliensis]
MAWNTSQIPDLTGRTFVVTGANGGIGKHTTKQLAAKGATVIMACRNTTTAQQVADRIDGDVRVAALDLADLASVRTFAEQTGEFDVLINNAGLMNIPFSRTKDGFETQWGVNHLGHFALTGLLLDRIGDRVVTLASVAHRQATKLRVDDLNYEHRRYQRNVAYAQAKLSNLLFGRELQRRLAEAGSNKRSYAVHPGVSATDLFTRTETPIDRIAKPFIAIVGHSPAKAAESSLFAATMPDADPNIYWGPTWLFGSQGPVKPSPSTKLSKDREVARRLWEESERLTGVTYKF